MINRMDNLSNQNSSIIKVAKSDNKTNSITKANNKNDTGFKALAEETGKSKSELFRKQRESERLRIDPDEILYEEEKRQLFCQQDL